MGLEVVIVLCTFSLMAGYIIGIGKNNSKSPPQIESQTQEQKLLENHTETEKIKMKKKLADLATEQWEEAKIKISEKLPEILDIIFEHAAAHAHILNVTHLFPEISIKLAREVLTGLLREKGFYVSLVNSELTDGRVYVNW